MKRIDISTEMYPNTFTLVDDKDFEEFSEHRWYRTKICRVVRCVWVEKKMITIYMHRAITKVKKGQDVDHINHNPLDNRRSNLRLCTKSQNQHNQQPRKGCSSKYKGVSWNKQNKKWTASIRLNGKHKNLGHFYNEIFAAKVYDEKARELFEEFACLNFPDCSLK